MKKSVIYFVVLLLLNGCDSVKKPEYRFQNEKNLFLCNGTDMETVKEAVYVFEDYITEHYAFLSKTVGEGYHNYIKLLLDDRSPASEFFSEYLIEFKDYLKTRDEFWVEKNGQLRLNYDNELVSCIINNIQDEQIRKTIDALVSSNTARPELLGPVLYRNRTMMTEDRALATYVVFETFFPKLFYMDSPEFISNAEKLRIRESIKKADIEKVDTTGTK